MKQTVKRGLALLMTVVMCLSLIPAMAITASAAESDYIYNWGSRGTVATSLSESAASFYTENNTTYATLSQLSGGTSEADAPSSDLYAALQKLMKDNHSTITSYKDTTSLYQYTDCQNGGGKISAFYSGAEVGPAWDSGSTWNREHTWPNSKGLGGSDENDIMMLRPAKASTNSSRGNKAYGESSGYYNPNTVSGGTYNLHGDVARIMLYVYVRWGNTEKMWRSTGVMENLDVLIKWMAEDPVDTWEMGRNDSVESITGTRNVFVDYPELAFLLFGEDVPNDMTTPSGEAKNHKNCEHQYQAGTPVPATCTSKGYTPYTCGLCGKIYKDNYTDMLDHTYVDGVCSCGAKAAPEYVTDVTVGQAYKLGLYSTNKSKEYYFKGTMSNYYGATSTTYDEGVDIYLEETTGGYHLYFMDTNNTKQYINLVQSGTYYNFTFNSSATSVFAWDADKDALHTTVGAEDCYMGTYGTYVTMGVLRVSKMKDTDYIARLYTMGSSSGEGGETPHEHSYTAVVTPPTCTEGGYTTHTCSCGDSYKDTEVAALGHNYVDGACSVCGEADPNAGGSSEPTTATITFDDKAKRTEYSSSKQVWTENGITVTNNKGASTNDVGDYYKPARFYQGSNLVLEYPGMTKIEVTCNNYKTSYPTDLKNSITSGTVTVSGKVVTITLSEAVDTYTIAKLSKQVRVDSITVYAVAKHTHSYEAVVTPPTCTEGGYTTHTCSCGDSYKDTEVAALGHNYVDGACSVCGEADPNAPSGEPTKATITFDDKAKRTELTTSKQVWTENGITVTNNKAASSNNVADYAKPARFYASSELIIAYPGMTKIEVTCNSSSYATALKNSITGATVNGKVVTITLSEATDTYKVAKLSAQVRVDSITVYAEASQPEHKHSYEAVVTPPTCTEGGYTTHTCSCGDSYKDTEVAALGHNYVDGACSVCGAADPNAPAAPVESWTLVTNVADLKIGDKIVIVAKNATTAMSTTQNSNNRGSANVTKSGDTVTFDDKVQIIELVAGKKANTFGFKVGAKYLYAASSSKNYLRTESTLSNNSSWSITIASSGAATIKAQGGNTRNWMRYNTNNGNPIFACYSSGQQDIAIYKLTVSQPACSHEWSDATCTAPKTCGLCGETEGEALGHSWNDATCAAPKTCSKCGETEGEALDHSWNDATCTAPKTCGTCGATEGSALGHSYVKSMTTAPTCTNAGIVIYTCTRCGDTSASAIPAPGHTLVNGVCVICGDDGQPSEGKNPAQLCGGGKDCILHAFSDINVGAWYHDGVHYCVEHALFQGLPGGKFGPTETTTRAQLITILWRLEGSPMVNYLMDFDDVESEQWYTEAVRWAAAEKIVGGYGNGLFGINDAITREQMATILWRYAQYKKQDVSVGESTNILSYGDVAQVNEYAIPAMQWACGAGLIQGIAADNTMNLDPTGSANRAQVATILYRYCEEFAK